jgi:hypothetical protein
MYVFCSLAAKSIDSGFAMSEEKASTQKFREINRISLKRSSVFHHERSDSAFSA